MFAVRDRNGDFLAINRGQLIWTKAKNYTFSEEVAENLIKANKLQDAWIQILPAPEDKSGVRRLDRRMDFKNEIDRKRYFFKMDKYTSKRHLLTFVTKVESKNIELNELGRPKVYKIIYIHSSPRKVEILDYQLSSIDIIEVGDRIGMIAISKQGVTSLGIGRYKKSLPDKDEIYLVDNPHNIMKYTSQGHVLV